MTSLQLMVALARSLCCGSSDLAVSCTFVVSTDETFLFRRTSDVVQSGRGCNKLELL